MKDRILQLCKRLNRFTLDEIATISEISADKLLPTLNELILESKLLEENGTYILLSKFEDDVVFEYNITIMDDQFNLGILTMKCPEGEFQVDFDK